MSRSIFDRTEVTCAKMISSVLSRPRLICEHGRFRKGGECFGLAGRTRCRSGEHLKLALGPIDFRPHVVSTWTLLRQDGCSFSSYSVSMNHTLSLSAALGYPHRVRHLAYAFGVLSCAPGRRHGPVSVLKLHSQRTYRATPSGDVAWGPRTPARSPTTLSAQGRWEGEARAPPAGWIEQPAICAAAEQPGAGRSRARKRRGGAEQEAAGRSSRRRGAPDAVEEGGGARGTSPHLDLHGSNLDALADDGDLPPREARRAAGGAEQTAPYTREQGCRRGQGRPDLGAAGPSSRPASYGDGRCRR
jgi:hypothetical protein